MEELKPMLPIQKNLTGTQKLFLDWNVVLASPKIDGIHVLSYNDKIITRNGVDLTSRFPSLISELSKQPVDLILDCELVSVDTKILPRREIHRKILSHETKGVGKPCLMIFDALRIGEDITSLHFNERYSLLLGSLRFSDKLQVIPQKVVKNERELQRIYKKSLAHGFEGLILRNAYGDYEVGQRSFGLRKLKPIDLVDLKVVGKEFVKGLRMYSLVNQNGVIMRVKDCRNFEVGEFVEVGYEGKYRSGKLKFPKIVRRKLDKSDFV